MSIINSEYTKSTKDQIEKFSDFLVKVKAGNMTLVDEITEAQIRIHEAISGSFKAKELMEIYAKKEPEYIRTKIQVLMRNFQLKNIDQISFTTQMMESLLRLQKIDELRPEETKMFKHLEDKELEQFAKAETIMSIFI